MAEGTDRPVHTPQKTSTLFPAIMSMSTDEGQNNIANTLNLSEPLSLPTTNTAVAYMSRPSYKIEVTCGWSIKSLYTTVAFLDTAACVNFIHSALIAPARRNRVKKKAPPRLRTATKYPVQFEGLIMLYLRPEDLCTRVWFGIAPQFAINMLLGASFICFMGRIFPS